MEIKNEMKGFRKMHRKLIWAVLVPCFFLSVPFMAKAQSVEYFVKASLLTKIAQYTEWDSKNNTEFFEIAILGKSPFKGELEKLASTTRIKNKHIKVKYIQDSNQAKSCQMLFICQSERKNLDEILHAFSTKNVMLISDTPEFSGKGIHFNFYTDKDKTIHFEIDLNALKKSGLKPDLQLLTIGKIINKS